LLQHILERCKRVTNIVEKITYEELLKNPIYQDALSYSIQTIGEAVAPPSYLVADQVTTAGMAYEYAMNLYAKRD